MGRRSGFKLPSLRAAKTSSTGAAEYEYGPENIIGSPIRAILSFISALLCHAALSSRIMESSCHPGDSRSSYRMRYLRNNVITSASVFACVREYHNLPSVSNATIKDILGATYLSVIEPEESVGTHILRKNRVWLIQL